MPANQILKLRKSLDLTQRALAERVGTSQQQIQRIEAGIQTVRLDLAGRIAAALDAKIFDVFPGLAISKRGAKSKGIQSGKPSAEVLRRAGIDPDPRQWTLKFFFFDGRKFLFQVTSADRDRIESCITDSDKAFLVFDSEDRCVAINRQRVAAYHFLFDPPAPVARVERESFEIDVHLISAKEPLRFGVEPDNLELKDDGEGLESQLQNLIFLLDSASDADAVIWFDDEDAERVYLRTNELLMVQVPLVCCTPSLWENFYQNFSDEEPCEDSQPEPRA
jgi:transcriptional regulator with XRE-family HTH domain